MIPVPDDAIELYDVNKKMIKGLQELVEFCKSFIIDINCIFIDGNDRNKGKLGNEI